jgi:hypothetical protein
MNPPLAPLFSWLKKLILPGKRAFKEESFRRQITNAIPVKVSFTALNWLYVTRAAITALVPQSQFRAVRPYYTGSAHIVDTKSRSHVCLLKLISDFALF